MNDIMQKLQAPFPADDIEWRVQRAMRTKTGDKAIVVPYITNRAIQNRLDEIFGLDGWKNEFREIHKGIICGINCLINGNWIMKWDGSDLTNIEATKGGLSGSMKRAAVQWGIGRYLYNLSEYWVDVKDKGKHYINSKVKAGKEEVYITGYWDEPELPSWALPKVEQKGISLSQKREIETKVKTLKDLINKDAITIYQELHISDIEQLTEDQAKESIKQLTKWVKLYAQKQNQPVK